MFNCYRLFKFGRQIAILPTVEACCLYIAMDCHRDISANQSDFNYEGAFIDGARF